MFGHNGKEIVLAIEWKGDHYIMKGRSIKDEDMVTGSDSLHGMSNQEENKEENKEHVPSVKELVIQHQHYVEALHHLVNVTFGGSGLFQPSDSLPRQSQPFTGSMFTESVFTESTIYTANNLLPFEFNGNISLLNSTALRNTYLLSQVIKLVNSMINF